MQVDATGACLDFSVGAENQLDLADVRLNPKALGLSVHDSKIEAHISVSGRQKPVVVQVQPVLDSQHNRLPIASDALQASDEVVDLFGK